LDFTPPPRTAGPVEALTAKAVTVPPDVAEASGAVDPPVSVRPASCWETLNRTWAPAVASRAAPAASELTANDPASSRNRSTPLSVTSPPGQGTLVRAVLPLHG
jgi:hypothetical protein